MTAMNNSSATPEEVVQQINDELAQLLIPAIVYICINMVTGLVGNLMVCYYYGFKAKMTPTSVFILALAACDLITCTVTMPDEIGFCVQFYNYRNSSSCKLLHFISQFAVASSVLILPAIAIDRYRHICVSSVYKTTVKGAMKQCAIVAIIALFFIWPALVIMDMEITPLPAEYGKGLKGTTCSRKTAFNAYSFVWDVVYLIMFFLCMAILVVLYFRICKVLYVHRQSFRKSATSPYSDTQSKRSDTMTSKLTIGMIVITTVFFLSFIPRLTIYLCGIKLQPNGQSSNAELVLLWMGTQSYMLNSSINPWIYGVFNSKFRQFYYRKLCRCSRDATATTSTGTTLESIEYTQAEQTV